MLADGRFTRDLTPCSRRMAQRLPEWADTARRLLEWAIAPPCELRELEQIVLQLEPALVRAAREAGLVRADSSIP